MQSISITPRKAEPRVTLTDAAAAKVAELIEKEGDPSLVLRLGVRPGGCSGFSYILGFDERKEKDQIYEIEGLPVFIERSHGMYLLGMEIDWHEGLNNRGFVFNNPNATDTCGCGSSFSA